MGRRRIGETGHGSSLRARRKELGLTQQKVAEIIGVSATHIHNLETEKRRLTPMVKEALQKAFGEIASGTPMVTVKRDQDLITFHLGQAAKAAIDAGDHSFAAEILELEGQHVSIESLLNAR